MLRYVLILAYLFPSCLASGRSGICFCNVFVQHVQLLVLVCSLYHYTKYRVKSLGGFFCVGRAHAQRIASDAARSLVDRVR